MSFRQLDADHPLCIKRQVIPGGVGFGARHAKPHEVAPGIGVRPHGVVGFPGAFVAGGFVHIASLNCIRAVSIRRFAISK